MSRRLMTNHFRLEKKLNKLKLITYVCLISNGVMCMSFLEINWIKLNLSGVKPISNYYVLDFTNKYFIKVSFNVFRFVTFWTFIQL